MTRREEVIDVEHPVTARSWSWQWVGWASWPVSPLVLVVSAAAVALDVASAWAGQPEWYLGRVLVSPALPLALVLVWSMGPSRIGFSRRGLRAWREFLVVTGVAIAGATIAYTSSIAGWREVDGLVLTAVGEEIVYRIGAVLLVGAACARLSGRDWRDSAKWGTGPVLAGLFGAAASFTVLPGHVDQMSGVGSVVPFVSLGVLLGYVALRTGSVLPCIVVHLLLDLSALAFFAGSISNEARLAIACALLIGVTLAMMPAGRRLGLRKRLPAEIDLRAPIDDGQSRPAATRGRAYVPARSGAPHRTSR